MKTLLILATILTSFIITPAYAADTPMQCNLTCKTDYTVSAGMQTDAESESDAAELSKPVMVADAANPLAPAKSVMYAGASSDQPSVNDLIATQNSSTGGFDFVTECIKYQGKIWAWREGKCKSLSPDWKSPGIGNTIKQ